MFKTLNVFVGYGGARAEKVAKKLTRYLRRNGFKTFLAAPGSKSMIGGLDFGKRIFRALADGDLTIMVCTRATLRSRPANGEIKFAQSIDTEIIPFVERGSRTPSKLRRKWMIRFDGDDPGKNFPELVMTLGQLGKHVRATRGIRKEAYL